MTAAARRRRVRFGPAAWFGLFALLLQALVVPVHLAHDVAEDITGARHGGADLAAVQATPSDHHHGDHAPAPARTPAHNPHEACFVCLTVHFAGTSVMATPIPLPPTPPVTPVRRPPAELALAADGLRIVLPPSRAPPARA